MVMDVRNIEDVAPVVEHNGTVPVWWMVKSREMKEMTDGGFLERIAALDQPAAALLSKAAQANNLTARGWTRTLKLARTIADLDGATAVRRLHVAEALIYRRVGPAAEMARV